MSAFTSSVSHSAAASGDVKCSRHGLPKGFRYVNFHLWPASLGTSSTVKFFLRKAVSSSLSACTDSSKSRSFVV